MEVRADRNPVDAMIASRGTHASNGDQRVGLTIAAAKLIADRVNSAKRPLHCRRSQCAFFHTRGHSKA